MEPAHLLKTQPWQHIQLYWESLSAFCEHFWNQNDPDYFADEDEPPTQAVTYGELNWDLLRLFIDRRLSELQPLILKQFLTQDESTIIQRLVLLRFEQVLQRLNYQRQQLHHQYAVSPDPYLRPLYSRYHALREVEELLQEFRKDSELNKVLTLGVCQHMVEDLNMELIEQYAKTLPPEQKPTVWPVLLRSLMLLSCNQISHPMAMNQVMDLMRQENLLELAIRVLQSSPFARSLESALVVAGAVPVPEVRQAIYRLLHRKEIDYQVQKKAIKVMAEHPEATDLPVLFEVIQSPLDDNHKRDLFFYQVREAAIMAMAAYSQSSTVRVQVLQILQDSIQSPVWGPQSQLQAIRMLAQCEVYVGFELAVTALQMSTQRDFARIQELAADTLVALRDRRAIPFLISTLNTFTQSETVMERYKGLFQKEKQSTVDHLCRCLQQFGVQVSQDMVTGEWFED